MKFPYGEICGWPLDWSHLEGKPGEGVSIIIYVFVPMLTLNPSVLPSTLKSTLGQYLLSKLKKGKKALSLNLFLLIFLLLFVGMNAP